MAEREDEMVVRHLLSAQVRAWDEQDADAAVVFERLCKRQIEKWIAIESAARELIHIPALIQALGDNHVGGCSCPLCKLRLALRDTSGKG